MRCKAIVTVPLKSEHPVYAPREWMCALVGPTLRFEEPAVNWVSTTAVQGKRAIAGVSAEIEIELCFEGPALEWDAEV